MTEIADVQPDALPDATRLGYVHFHWPWRIQEGGDPPLSVAIRTANADVDERAILAQAELWHGCEHPTVILLYGFDLRSRTMVMERAEESLRGVLQAGGYVSAAKGISFDDTRRAIVTFGLACGVAWLHSGEAAKREVVIHGDIRPRHVLLDGNLYPKLCDFGLASVYHEDSVKPTNAGMGAYLPPEICGGDAKNGYTPARDVWGLGWTIVQVYGAGAPVAQGTAPSLEALRLLPPRLLPIVEKCFAPDPSDRITSFAVAEACYDGTVWDDIDQEEFSTYHAMAVKFVPGLDYDPHK